MRPSRLEVRFHSKGVSELTGLRQEENHGATIYTCKWFRARSRVELHLRPWGQLPGFQSPRPVDTLHDAIRDNRHGDPLTIEKLVGARIHPDHVLAGDRPRRAPVRVVDVAALHASLVDLADREKEETSLWRRIRSHRREGSMERGQTKQHPHSASESEPGRRVKPFARANGKGTPGSSRIEAIDHATTDDEPPGELVPNGADKALSGGIAPG